MPTRTRTLRAGVVLLLVAAIVWPPAAFAAPKDKAQIHDFETGAPVQGSFSMLDRSADGITSRVRTRVTPGNAYTTWFVIFNRPEACSDGACGEDDLFDFGGDPQAETYPFNVGQIEATRASVVWTRAGAVANRAGRVGLDGALSVDTDLTGPGHVVIGTPADDALVPLGVVTGLTDPAAAEVHIVVQDHGAAHDDPDLLNEQLTSFAGACNPDCVDVQFAVHSA